VSTTVILRSDIRQVGKRGDIIEVSDGYARNYLLPKKLAIPASEGAVAQAHAMRRARDLRDAQDRDAATTIASRLVPKVITISAKAGTEGRLYGSITTADVVKAVADQTGITLDRRHLHVDEAIKTLGSHQVIAKLHADVEFPITVEVTAA
jgi:large subunit ribosomal protein L9